MHYYPYDGCDCEEPGPPPGSDSKAADAHPQRSLIILLDDDDESDGFEQPVHPLPSHRPKRPLPRSFSRNYRPPAKAEEAVQGAEMSRDAPQGTMISCAPGLRDKSPEEARVECHPTTGKPPRPIGSGMGGIPPNPLLRREQEGNKVSSAGQDESPIHDVRMDD